MTKTLKAYRMSNGDIVHWECKAAYVEGEKATAKAAIDVPGIVSGLASEHEDVRLGTCAHCKVALWRAV